MRLASPYFLLLLLACPVLFYLERLQERMGRGSLLYSATLGTPLTHRAWLAKNLYWMRLAVIALLAFAMARPQLIQSYDEITSEGIDIILAIDVSGSMAAEDFKPKNRLSVAKDVVVDFIAGRRGDRIGLIIFAGISITKCPLTTDYVVLRSLLMSVAMGELEDGTAIGNALANCANRLRNSKVKSKVIILLTDGVNNRGEISPLDAADVARTLKIKVYTIGAGTTGLAPYPIDDPVLGRTYTMLPVELDEDLLRAIASKTGGLYFRATDKQSLDQIYSQIDKLERSKIESKTYKNHEELFVPIIWSGLFLLLVALIAGETYLRRLS